MPPLVAYADRLSVRPGQTIRFHGRGPSGEALAASVVRVICADPNPAIGGVQTETVAADVTIHATLTPRHVPLGSYAEAPLDGISMPQGSFTCVAEFRCTHLPEAGAEAAILAIKDEHNGIVFALTVAGHETNEDRGRDRGTLDARTPAGSGRFRQPIDRGVWYKAVFTYSAASQDAVLALVDQNGLVISSRVEQGVAPTEFGAAAVATIASFGRVPDAEARDETSGLLSFNGRIGPIALINREMAVEDACAVHGSGDVDGVVAFWDPSLDITSDLLVDTGPSAAHAKLINSPTRGVRGANWSGRTMSWPHAPADYNAIHFHDDDIDDCRWPVIADFRVPSDLPSGQYALMLEAGGHADNVPFWVVPPKATATSKLAVLVSTFTYTVYGNHARPEWTMEPGWQQAWREQAEAWGAYPHNPGDHRDLGLSTYNAHTDGAGISIASWHRPMLNLRVGYLTYPYSNIRASGLRHYQADTHLTMWLEAKGSAYDIITDWELHTEGIDVLSRYTSVLTGTHPEYHTRQMLDALTNYRDGGGRLCYLGGNGFYWKIALHPEKAGVIEIRRAEGGIRAWAAEPGEYYNQFDGEYGGLWRRNGRPPQQLTGVGFSAQGNFVGSHYIIAPKARDGAVSWIFENVDGDKIGHHGFSGHGAAGFELDRADAALGTPPNAIVLARSEGHEPDAPWVLVPEERLTHLTTIPGAKDEELIRADMVFFTTAKGQGAVFSTGSITYCGSLPTNGFDNDISQLTENVVRRFLDPTPFE
ncbi:MAG: N,N-dimethylformamidase beta subunit family domain-containing protein [Pseudomonadota bacterium]